MNKLTYTLLLINCLLAFSCQRSLEMQSNIEEDPNENVKVAQAYDLIDEAFEKWKANEIKMGRMQDECPKYGSDEFADLVEIYNDDNRWTYTKTLNKLYSDFNGDEIVDGLIVFERQDCVEGNGYIGDNQVSILFVSKNNTYEKDSVIVTDMQKALNSKALNIWHDEKPTVAYTEILSVDGQNIKGVFYDWKNGDPTGQPSIKRNFSYNYKENKVVIF